MTLVMRAVLTDQPIVLAEHEDLVSQSRPRGPWSGSSG